MPFRLCQRLSFSERTFIPRTRAYLGEKATKKKKEGDGKTHVNLQSSSTKKSHKHEVLIMFDFQVHGVLLLVFYTSSRSYVFTKNGYELAHTYIGTNGHKEHERQRLHLASKYTNLKH